MLDILVEKAWDGDVGHLGESCVRIASVMLRHGILWDGLFATGNSEWLSIDLTAVRRLAAILYRLACSSEEFENLP